MFATILISLSMVTSSFTQISVSLSRPRLCDWTQPTLAQVSFADITRPSSAYETLAFSKEQDFAGLFLLLTKVR